MGRTDSWAIAGFLALSPLACSQGGDDADPAMTGGGAGSATASSTGEDSQSASATTASGGTNSSAASSTGPDDPPGSSSPTSEATTDAASSSPSSGPDSSTGDQETGDTDDGGTDPTGDQSGGGVVDVTLSGCAVDFDGEIIVSYNGSLSVGSIYDGGASLSGSIQFDLDGPATFELSSQHRVDTGTVVNLIDPGQGTWTNIDNDALTGGEDSIGGTLDVSVWEPASGRAQVQFTNVSLQNVVDLSVCTINGSVDAMMLYP